VPEVLVTGGGGGALDGLAATLMRTLGTGNGGANARKAIDQVAADAPEDTTTEADAPAPA
jgi:hypothetical protein